MKWEKEMEERRKVHVAFIISLQAFCLVLCSGAQPQNIKVRFFFLYR